MAAVVVLSASATAHAAQYSIDRAAPPNSEGMVFNFPQQIELGSKDFIYAGCYKLTQSAAISSPGFSDFPDTASLLCNGSSLLIYSRTSGRIRFSRENTSFQPLALISYESANSLSISCKNPKAEVGSGLIGYSQKATMEARQAVAMKVAASLS
jgi:hypothetical protein